MRARAREITVAKHRIALAYSAVYSNGVAAVGSPVCIGLPASETLLSPGRGLPLGVQP
jgi:hypothetical protein